MPTKAYIQKLEAKRKRMQETNMRREEELADIIEQAKHDWKEKTVSNEVVKSRVKLYYRLEAMCHKEGGLTIRTLIGYMSRDPRYRGKK